MFTFKIIVIKKPYFLYFLLMTAENKSQFGQDI